MNPTEKNPIIWWEAGKTPALWRADEWLTAVQNTHNPLFVLTDPTFRQCALGVEGQLLVSPHQPHARSFPVRAVLPGLYPEQLGSAEFKQAHSVRFAYVGGSMARGIASPQLVIALARMGALGFYGSAGVPLGELERNLQHLQRELSRTGLPWGANLIHSPAKPEWEDKIVDLLLKYQVTRVESSAFMQLQPAVVRYACAGLRRGQDGSVIRRNYLLAKVSRPEVARHFMLPAPEDMLRELLQRGQLTREETECAREVSLAADITAEGNSGGHTDNRPLDVLFSRLTALRAELNALVRLGAAGGLGTPQAIAAAFALGADYVLPGSVHQATLEAGISPQAKQMLAQADIADVGMTASADMFEQGVKVQVLTRGTLMAARGNQLYQLYKSYPSLEAIPAKERAALEKNIFRESLEQAWQRTRERALQHNPQHLAKAEGEPKLKMAMLFRAYLGQSSRWPIEGETARQSDYQIWCGAAMGAFNAWTKHSFLAEPRNRGVEQVALNLLQGATQVTRAQQLRVSGLPLPKAAFDYRPKPLTVNSGERL